MTTAQAVVNDGDNDDAVVPGESSRQVLADGSFPWWFLVLGVAAVALGAILAFRPISMRRR